MKLIKKILSYIFSIFVIFALLTFIAGILIPVNIKKPVRDLLKTAHNDSVEMEKASLHLPDDIKFTNFRLQNRLSKSHTLHINSEKIHGDIRFFYTLSKRKKLQSALKGKFNWNFVQNKDYHIPFLFNELSNEDTILVPIFEKIKLNNCKIEIDSSGYRIAKFNNMDLDINTSESKLPSFDLNIKCKEAEYYNILKSSFEGNFNLKQNFLTSDLISGTLSGGTFKIKDFKINPIKNTIHGANISAKKINADQIFKLDKGKIKGSINLKAQIDSSFLSLPYIRSRGTISIKDLKAENIPLLKKVVKLTEIKALEKVEFEKFNADFKSQKGKINSDSIIAVGKDFSLTGSGYIKPENLYFYYNVTGVFEPHMKDSMSALVWDALLPGKDGKKYFTCLIEGTPQNPSVHLKREMVKSAAKSIFKSIKQDFKSLFN